MVDISKALEHTPKWGSLQKNTTQREKKYLGKDLSP